MMAVLGTILGAARRVPWQVWLALALVLALWRWGEHRYTSGWDARTAAYEVADRAAEKTRLARERAAAARDAALKRSGEAAIDHRRQETDDAKRDLPDQGLSARQRVRACSELRRQGRPCPPAPAAR